GLGMPAVEVERFHQPGQGTEQVPLIETLRAPAYVDAHEVTPVLLSLPDRHHSQRRNHREHDSGNGRGAPQTAPVGCLLPPRLRIRHVLPDPTAVEDALVDAVSYDEPASG